METPNFPTALTIAGSDSCAGAGVQADLKAFTILGVYGTNVLTAITAQNTLGVQHAFELPLDLVRQQFNSVTADIIPSAVKTGMLATIPMIELVAELLRQLTCPYVCDPVMVAKSGDPLIAPDAIASIRKHLLPRATVITPNRFEVQQLLRDDHLIASPDQARDAARQLADLGPAAVVLKAIPDNDRLLDLLYDGQSFQLYPAPQQPPGRSHGSGCTFSAAITAELAKNNPLPAAVQSARHLIDHAITHSLTGTQGTRPVNVIHYTQTEA